ncbi:MAG: hypothetical protein SFW36_00425, partial [Leptolyngbyaceae cyanobacterium bins.59]|nr:hypothetical protein [Leptolyngbyaceae cyanobacterium bins.59]
MSTVQTENLSSPTTKLTGRRYLLQPNQQLSTIRCSDWLALSKHLIAQYAQALHEQLCVMFPLKVLGSAEYADA